MAAVAAGTFEDQAGAQWAIQRLRAAGIPDADISVIARLPEKPAAGADSPSEDRASAAPLAKPSRPDVDPVIAEAVREEDVEPVTAEEYSATESGGAAGGLLGALSGFLVGLGIVALPGLGPIVAAGPLAGMLGGGAIGTATGGLIGALVDAGVPEEDAAFCAHCVGHGHILVVVATDAAPPERLREIMLGAGAVNLYPATT